MPNFGLPDRDLLDRISRLESQVNELARGQGQTGSAITDMNGASVIETDPVTGVGLSRPYIPLPFTPWDYRGWIRTTGTGYQSLWFCQTVKQHPAITMTLSSIASTGCAGRLRILVNGEALWPDVPVGETVALTQVGPFLAPGAFMAPLRIHVVATFDATAGVDPHLYCGVFNAYGIEQRDPLPLPS